MKELCMIVGALALSTFLISCDKNEIQSISDSLVASYPFDGDAKDASGNGFNGVIHGAQLTEDRNGSLESAYYFDGNLSYIDLGNPRALKRYMSDYTLTGWIKLQSYPPTYNSIIMSNRNHETSPISGSFIGIGGLQSSLSKRLEYIQNATPTDDEFTYDFMSSNTHIDLDTWYFFCLSYKYQGNQSNLVKVYVDGLLESQKLMGEVINPENVNTYLGCEPVLRPVEYSFHGCMDDIRIYDRALSESEIESLYER